MKKWYSVGAATVILLASAATACTSGEKDAGAKGGKSEHSDSLTPLAETCGGIVNGSTRSEISSKLKTDRVYWYGAAEGTARAEPAKVAEVLSRGMDRRFSYNSTCGFGRSASDDVAVNIWLDWWPETFEHVRGKIQGTSAAYDLTSGEPRLARMFVDCQRPDLVEPDKEMDLLRVVIDDRLQLSSKSRVRLLNAAGSQVIEFMDCKNKVTLPTVDAVVQVDPRLK